jgi:hypothetical protein
MHPPAGARAGRLRVARDDRAGPRAPAAARHRPRAAPRRARSTRRARVGVLDVGFRTTDYFTLDGLAVVLASCLTRNTGMADLLLDLGREVYRRWGVELDPHALDEPLRRGAPTAGATPSRSARCLSPGSTGTQRRPPRMRGCCGATVRVAWRASGSPVAAGRCSAPGSRPLRRAPSSSATPGCRTRWGTFAMASAWRASRAWRPAPDRPDSARASARFSGRVDADAPRSPGPSGGT